MEAAAHADARALAGGLHDHRQADLARGRHHVVAALEARVRRRRQAERQPHLLGADLVHREGRAEHARARVRHAERIEQALQHAVLAAAAVAVQDVEDAIEAAACGGRQCLDKGRDAVHGLRVHAAGAAAPRARCARSRATPRAPRRCRPSARRRDRRRAGRSLDARSCRASLCPAAACSAAGRSCAAAPMLPAPMVSTTSPSRAMPASTRGSSSSDLSSTGSTAPRERIARHSALPSAPGIGASPAGIDLGDAPARRRPRAPARSRRAGRGCACSDAARTPARCDGPARPAARPRASRRSRSGGGRSRPPA